MSGTKKSPAAEAQLAGVQDLIKKHSVILFSKSSCPFCLEIIRTLDNYAVVYEICDVDKNPNPAGLMAALKEISTFGTVPNLFVEGKSLGGCVDAKSMDHAGTLFNILAPYMAVKTGDGDKTRQKHLGLFWFPPVVDRINARLTSFLTCLYCLFCVGFYSRRATPWAVLGLAIDFLLRLTLGGHMSVGGMVAAMFLARVEPRFIAGPPKQFAAFCGLFFSVFGAGLFLGGAPAGGAVIIAMLMCAAGLEGLFDICLGCLIFGKAIKFNIIDKGIYRPYLNLVDYRKWMYHFSNARHKFPDAHREHVLLPWQERETPADLIRKNRIETEFKNSDVDIIRHARVDLFSVPMTIAALAYVFKLTDGSNDAVRFNTSGAYQTLAIIAVIIFCLLLLLYCLRLALYPRKVLKEWHHPVTGNMFSVISISITLFGLLLLPHSDNGGGTFIWIGGVMQMLMVVLRVTDLIQDYQTKELVNPSLMMVPVGAFISAIGFSQFEIAADGPNMHGKMNYIYIGRLWYGVAALFGFVLFVITFNKALHDSFADNRMRHTIFIWLATFSAAGPAFLSVSYSDAGPALQVSISAAQNFVGRDVFFQSLWCISLFFFMVAAVGLLRNFFSYVKDMSIWTMAFAYTTFALSTVQYYAIIQDQLFMALSIIAITIACVTCTICGCYTVIWLLTLDLFKPRPKWGPVSFMKLTHECFRFCIPKYVAMVFALSPTHMPAIERLVMDLEALFMTFMEHSHHEDMVLFPRVRRYMPQLNTAADEEHEYTHGMVDDMTKAIESFKEAAAGDDDDRKTTVAAELLELLQTQLPEWERHVLPHLRNEECTFTVAARKYLPLDEQIKITADVFELTEIAQWRKVMPFVVNNLPSMEWKVRYVKTFLWSNPARAQEIGLILYHGLDSVLWLALCREIPSLAPRGVPSNKRLY